MLTNKSGSSLSPLRAYAIAALIDVATLRADIYRCRNLFGHEGKNDEVYEWVRYSIISGFGDHWFSRGPWPTYVDAEILYSAAVVCSSDSFRPEIIDLIDIRLTREPTFSTVC